MIRSMGFSILHCGEQTILKSFIQVLVIPLLALCFCLSQHISADWSWGRDARWRTCWLWVASNTYRSWKFVLLLTLSSISCAIWRIWPGEPFHFTAVQYGKTTMFFWVMFSHLGQFLSHKAACKMPTSPYWACFPDSSHWAKALSPTACVGPSSPWMKLKSLSLQSPCFESSDHSTHKMQFPG